MDAPAETFYNNGTSLKGRVSGKIDKGGNWINLTVTRGSKYRRCFSLVPSSLTTRPGNLTYENHDVRSWDSPTQLICIPGAPVEDRPLPAQAPAPAPAPGPEPVAPVDAGTAPTEAQAPAPPEAAPAEPNQACIPDPFDLNSPGAC